MRILQAGLEALAHLSTALGWLVLDLLLGGYLAAMGRHTLRHTTPLQSYPARRMCLYCRQVMALEAHRILGSIRQARIHLMGSLASRDIMAAEEERVLVPEEEEEEEVALVVQRR